MTQKKSRKRANPQEYMPDAERVAAELVAEELIIPADLPGFVGGIGLIAVYDNVAAFPEGLPPISGGFAPLLDCV